MFEKWMGQKSRSDFAYQTLVTSKHIFYCKMTNYSLLIGNVGEELLECNGNGITWRNSEKEPNEVSAFKEGSKDFHSNGKLGSNVQVLFASISMPHYSTKQFYLLSLKHMYSNYLLFKFWNYIFHFIIINHLSNRNKTKIS